MKSGFIITLICVYASIGWSQQLVQDVALIEVNASNHAEAMIILNEQLANSRAQLQSLEGQLELLGTPADVTDIPGAEVAADTITTSLGDGLQTNAEIEAVVVGVDGSAVFDETLYGLTDAIGNTFEDGDENVDRDPDFYRPEAAMLGRIQEYQRVRDASIARREALKGAMIEALENVRTAESFAEIQKQRAVIDVLSAEVAAADTEIATAAKDVEMLQREFANHAQVINKASSERNTDQVEAVEEDGVDLQELVRQQMEWPAN